jgi:hypothetical protein
LIVMVRARARAAKERRGASCIGSTAGAAHARA